VRDSNWARLDKNGLDVLSKEWLEHRQMLFESICLPSVQAQDSRDFEWLVLFDKYTPLSIYDYPEYTPILCGSNWLTKLQWLLKGDQCTITTRLDNDDAIAPNFISSVRAVSKQRNMLIDAPHGYKVTATGCYRAKIPYGPFMSRVECGKVDTVYAVTHGDGAKALNLPVKTIKAEWAQTLHTRNLINHSTDGPKVQGPSWF